ncbi:Holliday junction branch migration protein RuvA [Gilvimarinus agarilyticus]|uniref:Holliday junction branch migration protein RuvA n=1 Tax=unclassified Gilvimarinus TaxID=2642066 RepID=UPI001C0A36FC|nr:MULTISPECIES: Holliday junction branch migration protein RuvA [unclassified Gilvimarinus]MBU2887383.1 Holliday junction branch migration protein RuvA [Gilvimarinus agarilyticus]MDO6572042.1 Holliday junction branch migration protein RuvA [Gilvimarinus sp. 2_MG-2023]MDO6746102.1 Holliday junction branch migration protein RuvA [Gilvimarinus sp. 1_MG-2023]
MIGRLHGTLLEKQAPFLLLDVGGVGYEVQAPMTTFYALPELNQPATLFTHLAVSETAQQLFGFAQRSERDLFRTLIKVNGVGPKMAVAILSGLDAMQIAHCVHEDNVGALVKVPGVGKKTAERLVIELRDKLPAPAGGDLLNPEPRARLTTNADSEAESALVALGYKPTEASRMVNAAKKAQPAASAQELIRLSLKKVAG